MLLGDLLEYLIYHSVGVFQLSILVLVLSILIDVGLRRLR